MKVLACMIFLMLHAFFNVLHNACGFYVSNIICLCLYIEVMFLRLRTLKQILIKYLIKSEAKVGAAA